ncbi:MAG: choice-of-anchor D domain-containing protein [Planctomycetota bacterium]
MLESRHLLAAGLGASTDLTLVEFENDSRLADFFHGPLRPGASVPLIQGISSLAEQDVEDPIGAPSADNDQGDGGGPIGAPPFSLDQTFKLHSRPDSNFTIYLDFDGHVSVGTSWNFFYGFDEIVHPNYWGGTDSNFSDARLELIQEIWQVVAEDFAPFDVNVTTEEPADLEDLRKVNSEDTRWGARVLMTRDTFANCGCGGHAFLGAFDDRTDEAAIVYNGGLNAGSETVSHEVGHQLGLRHDGNGGNTYYRGHGNGTTGWGPIMGAPFSKLTTHWNDGDYFTANEDEDDLALITRAVNFPYLEDDFPNDRSSAVPLEEIETTGVEAFGIIERNTDVDWFKFTTGAGNVSFNFDVLGYKPNLDVWAGLFDSSGTFIAEANPQDALDASLTDVALDAGTYYLKIDGVARNGSYDPVADDYVEPTPAPYTVTNPQGYSDYGSIGQYRISGTIVDPGGPNLSIAAVNPEVGEGGTAEFTFSTSDNSSATVTVAIRPARQAAPGLPAPHPAEPEDFTISVTQQVTITNGSGTLSVPITADSEVEFDEVFEVVIVDSAGYQVSNRTAETKILESLTAYRIVEAGPNSAKGLEGDVGVGSVHQFTIMRDGNRDSGHTVSWSRSIGGGANNADFVGSTFGAVSFVAGELEKTIDIEIAGDREVEGDETYGIEVIAAFGQDYLISAPNGPAIGTIVGDESTISIDGDVVLEEADSGVTVQTISVTRGGFTEKATSVDWTLMPFGETPVSAADFENGLPSGTITFDADVTMVDLELRVQGDTEIEGNESFVITFSNHSGGPLPPNKVGIVEDDDTASPEISVTGLGGNSIVNGDTTPSEEDGTLYPLAKVVDMTIERSFQIANTGTLPLVLSDFQVEGTHADDFIIGYGGDGTLAPGESGQFTLTFDPSAPNVRNATVVIENNDPDQGDFTFAIQGSATSLEVEQIEIANSTGTSRSQLPSIKLTFNELVEHRSLVEGFSVYAIGGQQFFPSFSVQIQDANDRTEATFLFQNSSIIDGFYELRVHSDSVMSASDPSYPLFEDYYFAPGRGGGEVADSFFRFFGDSDGDRDVDRDDLFAFQAAYRSDSNSTNFDSQFDFDGDDDIDAIDFAEFRKRLGRRL